MGLASGFRFRDVGPRTYEVPSKARNLLRVATAYNKTYLEDQGT